MCLHDISIGYMKNGFKLTSLVYGADRCGVSVLYSLA